MLDHKNQFKFENTAFLFVAIQIWIFYCFAGFATSYCRHFELLDLLEVFVFCAKTIRISNYGLDAVVVFTLDLGFLFKSCSAYCGS